MKRIADMGWTYGIIWFLCLSASECFHLPGFELDISGEVHSPQYPRPYHPNVLETWTFGSPDGYQMQLSISHLDIKASPGCSQDSLTILYGKKTLGKFCGQENSTDHPGKEIIFSPGKELTLIFQTSDSTSEVQEHIGFSATYKATVIDCGEPEPLLNGGVTFLSGSQNLYPSDIQYHCNEPFYSLPEGANVNFTCEADRKWRSNHSDVIPACLPVCGQPTKLISTYQRIVGGGNAPDDTFPWQVKVRSNGDGGGMVIGDRWIMTAAQIIRSLEEPKPNNVQIYMGHTDVDTLMRSPVFAASLHVHPEYNETTYNNDIALIKLKDPITFNSSVMPICLPAEGATYDTGVMGLLSGFGVIAQYHRASNKLRYVELPVVDQEICRNSMTSLWSTPSLTDNMFCAGVPEGGKDSCNGDGGSALALRDNGQFWAAGISSWGVGCGLPGKYGVFTRVANYVDWIKKTMQEN